MNKEELGREIAEFIWDFDLYGARDCFDTLAEMITETIRQLYVAAYRKAMAKDLKDIAEWCEEDVYAYKASMLWREVMAI